MSSRKINALLVLGFGIFAFNGFTTLGAANIPTVVESENKDKLADLVTVNENAPVKIVYGTEQPIEQLLTVINQNIKNDYETLKYVGISEVHKEKYVSKNSEVYLEGYNKNDFTLNEVIVEVRTNQLLTDIQEVKKYRVLVKIIDTNAPEIALEEDSIEIVEGDSFDVESNVASVLDKEDGEITNFTVSGDYDTEKAGEYSIVVTAVDNSKNKTEKTFKLVVKEKPVEIVTTASGSSSAVAGNYSYNISGAVFAAPNPNHMAALNGGAAGYCTWYIYNRLDQLGAPIPYRMMGNANQWPYYAQRYGYNVSKTARVGTVVATNESYYGHVAFVEQVNADGSIVVSEMNYVGLYQLTTRTIPASQAANATYIDFGLGR